MLPEGSRRVIGKRKEMEPVKTVKKKESRRVKAYCLGENNPVIDELIKKGLVKQTDESHWRIFSQEATDGEKAETGDYVKVDSSGMPYPNSRDFFLKNHRQVGKNEYEQIPRPLKAWNVGEPPCREIDFLIRHKGLSIDESSETAYFSAPLWGDTLTAARDAVIVFYKIGYDKSGEVEDAEFNFVGRSEFEKVYDVL